MLGVRVAGHTVAAQCFADSHVALWHAVHPARRTSRHPHWAAEAGADGTAAALPAQNGGAVDVAWLVRRAAEGDRWAWERLVDQYARLIWAMTRDFKLAESDAADVAQVTWLRLLEHIDRLEHPARLGSWLAATARHECLRAVAARRKIVLIHDDAALTDTAAHQPEADERLLADERDQAVRKALSRLPYQWQQLLQLLMADPPASYAEISDQLGLPVGSIGPTRGRCLEKLRVLLQAS
jgi:RNA polymerase sigma factor (sigma-70 family)